MRQRFPVWIVPALVLGVFGLGLYGYNENQNKRAAVQLSENQYQSSFHRYAAHMDEFQDALAKILVTRSARTTERQLTSALRQSSAAQANLEGLPALLTSHGSLTSYLTQTSAYLENVHLSHSDGTPISTVERNKLRQMYFQVSRLETDSRKLQNTLLSQLRSQQLTTAVVLRGKDPILVKQFDGIDGTAKQMLSENHKMSMDPLQIADVKTGYYLSNGPVINSNQAILRAKDFFGYNHSMSSRVQTLGPGFSYKGYLVTLIKGQQNTQSVAVSLHRGKVLWFSSVNLNNNMSGTSAPILNSVLLQSRAEIFLAKHEFPQVTLLRSFENSDQISYSYAPIRNGIVIEPQEILLKEDRKSGQVTEFDASAYYINGSLPALRSRISERTVLQGLSSDFKVEDIHLAVVMNAVKKPILVYEVLGRMSNNTFRVIVDATNGTQLNIEKLTKDDTV